MFNFKMHGAIALLPSIAMSQGALAKVEGTNTDKALVKGKEYMVLTNYPNNLQIIDVNTDRVYKTCAMPGHYGPGQVQMSPDKGRAYVLTNSFKEIYGINVDTCEMEFKARFSTESGEDTRYMFSMAYYAACKVIYTVSISYHE